jgi:hypothetical protein
VRHSIYLAIGMAFAAAFFRVPVWLWQRAAPWLFLAARDARRGLDPGIGREVNGSRRWIPPRIASFQPFGADEALRRALRGRLHGSQGRVHARLPQGLPADVRRDGAHRRAAACASPISARWWS